MILEQLEWMLQYTHDMFFITWVYNEEARRSSSYCKLLFIAFWLILICFLFWLNSKWLIIVTVMFACTSSRCSRVCSLFPPDIYVSVFLGHDVSVLVLVLIISPDLSLGYYLYLYIYVLSVCTLCCPSSVCTLQGDQVVCVHTINHRLSFILLHAGSWSPDSYFCWNCSTSTDSFIF